MSDVLVDKTDRSNSGTLRKPALATLRVMGTMIAVCYCVLFLGIGGGALAGHGEETQASLDALKSGKP